MSIQKELKESYSEFIINNLDKFLPYTVLTSFQAVGGLFGNLLIIGAILSTQKLHTKTNALILNLAISDLLVSVFVDTFNVFGALGGEQFFKPLQKFCTSLAVICMMNCVASSLGVALLAFNRYLFILYPHAYIRFFTWPKTIAYCSMTWIIGLIYYTPVFFDSKYSIFDPKTRNCIWNRKASIYYTVISLSITMISPSVSIMIFYSVIFIRKIKSNWIILNHQLNELPIRAEQRLSPRSSYTDAMDRIFKSTKGLFFSCILFLLSHIPYAVTVLIDTEDKLPAKLYMYSANLWHLNSALSCVLYAFTNSQLKKGYLNFLNLIFDRKSYSYTLNLDF